MSLLTLPISGAIGTVAVLVRGPLGLPLDDATEWARVTASGLYLVTQVAVLVAFVLPFFGLVSLYAYLARNDRVERLAFVGLLTSLIGTALALPALGILTFVAPVVSRLVLQGQAHLSQVVVEAITGPGLIVGLLSAILYTLGSLCLGIAVWRYKTLPKWAGVLFALHGLLLSFGFTFFPALILGWTLFTASGSWITWSIWKQTVTAVQ